MMLNVFMTEYVQSISKAQYAAERIASCGPTHTRRTSQRLQLTVDMDRRPFSESP